jgi:hypothetical protein
LQRNFWGQQGNFRRAPKSTARHADGRLDAGDRDQKTQPLGLIAKAVERRRVGPAAAECRQSARPRDLKSGEGQRLPARIFLQFSRGSSDAVPILSFEVGFDRIAGELQMVVADGPGAEQRLTPANPIQITQRSRS